MSAEVPKRKAATMYERKVQGYLPSKEMREEFTNDAKGESGGVSQFITHLYKLWKRGQLKPQDESRRPA
jgi:hypothetical protein